MKWVAILGGQSRPHDHTDRSGEMRTGVRPAARWAALILIAGVLAACGSGGPAQPAAAPPTTSAGTAPTATTTTVPPTTTTTEQPGWTVIGTDAAGIAVDERTISGPDGGVVTLVRYRVGSTTFALHVGSQDPPANPASIPAANGAAIASTETPVLLGAFNGGFKMSSAAGGFEVNGQVLYPLRAGLASLVIDTDGSAHVGVWGDGLPIPGEQVASVRQNLAPLVSVGVASASAPDVGAWGAMLGPGPAVPRSAVGQDPLGDIIYAASMSVVPSDLAYALVNAGVFSGMELDINPYWIQAVGAATPGAALSTLVPGQQRPADQFQAGWTRDFITVLAAP
jgi:hypothetical protein